jgi:hypothetical protein
VSERDEGEIDQGRPSVRGTWHSGAKSLPTEFLNSRMRWGDWGNYRRVLVRPGLMALTIHFRLLVSKSMSYCCAVVPTVSLELVWTLDG